MTDVDPLSTVDLAARLGAYPPFDTLGQADLDALATSARVETYAAGRLVLDAFARPSTEVYVVLDGRVELWNGVDRLAGPPDEVLGAGGLFGFSAMLTERSIGPRAVTSEPTTVARVPGWAITPAFASARGARFLAEKVSSAARRIGLAPTYSTVEELIVATPLVVDATTPVEEVARRMTESGTSCAVVRLGDGRVGIVTDSLLRERILVDGLPATSPAAAVMDPAPPVATFGDTAAETLISMVDRDASFVLVVDAGGEPRGVLEPRDFAVSPTAAGVSLHAQLRRAATVEELSARARRVPDTLSDLLSRGLASARVIAVHSALLDTVVRRGVGLVLARHPELSGDDFTWLSLGSNGRRESVLSSDVDSAVAFADTLPEAEWTAYRSAFAEVADVLSAAGLSRDDHGATAQRPLFSRTNAAWEAAAEDWLAAPVENNGAMMTSLLVDGRPIHGDPGLPAVGRVFGALRRHPATMRLLLTESLASRARLHSVRDVLARRTGSFDVKTHALLPIVNIARWAALSVGSSALGTTERLRLASGSAILPDAQAATLVEVFDTLQRLRLRYQLQQHQAGDQPSDVLVTERLSAIDRAVISQAVREVASVQRRMANVSAYVPTADWSSPAP